MKKAGAILWGMVEKVSLWCLSALFFILRRELTPQAKDAFLQFVKFGLVGVSNTVVNYAIYLGVLVCLRALGVWKGYDYLAATAAGFVLSVLWSFFWNNKFVFHCYMYKK